MPTVDCRDTNPEVSMLYSPAWSDATASHSSKIELVDYQVWNQPILGYEVLSSTEVTAREANQLIPVSFWVA